MRFITKIFIFCISFGLIIYLLFPLWSGWLLRTNLPENLTLESFETNYPGLQTIVVSDLNIKIDNHQIFIDEMLLDYDLTSFSLNNIHIKKLLIQQLSRQSDISNSDYQLPLIQFSDYDALLNFAGLKINEFVFKNNNTNYRLSQIDLSKQQDCVYKINGNIHQSEPIENNLQLNTELFCENNSMLAKINTAGKKLAEIEYKVDTKNLTLIATISSKELQKHLPDAFLNSSIKATGDIQLELLQNREVPHFDVNITSQVTLSNDKVLQQPILLATTASLSMNLEQQPLTADVSVTAQSLSALMINSPTSVVQSEPVTMNVASTVILINSDENEPQLVIQNTKANLMAKSLNVTETVVPLTLHLEDYVLTAKLSDIESSINNLLDSQWQLSGSLLSPQIKAGYDNENIKINSPLEMKFQLNNTNQLSSDGELTLTNVNTQYKNSIIQGQLFLNWQQVTPSFSTGNFSVVMDSNNSNILDLEIDNINFKTDAILKPDYINGEGNLTLNQQLLTPYTFELNKQTSEITITLEQNKLAHQLFNHYIAAIGKKNKIALNIGGGEIIHSAAVALSEKLLINSQFALKDLLFQFGENTIHGLNVEQKITSIDPLHLRSNMQIESIEFSSGLALKDISANISSNGDNTVEISSLLGKLLAGSLQAKSIIVTAEGMPQTLLELKQISLTELIFLMDVPGLYAEGDMEFNLPMAMLSGAMTINNGRFKSTNKGIIKYTNNQTELNSEENIALKALQNFHYESLSGQISYDKEGQYRIKIHLLGSNPDLYDGYPVDFVLNLQGELSGVFRSLFLTGSFEQAVLEQLKSTQPEQ